MGESRSSMETSTQYIEEISNETNRDKAESLVEVMEARYQTHGDMIESYKSVLESEKEVFEYLGEEDVSQDEVDERLNSLNGQYEKVEEPSAAFSEETGKVNELKKEIEDLIEGRSMKALYYITVCSVVIQRTLLNQRFKASVIVPFVLLM